LDGGRETVRLNPKKRALIHLIAVEIPIMFSKPLRFLSYEIQREESERFRWLVQCADASETLLELYD
jgi:hypothetical protein